MPVIDTEDHRDVIAKSATVAVGAAVKIMAWDGWRNLSDAEARQLSGLNPVGWKVHGAAALALCGRIAG